MLQVGYGVSIASFLGGVHGGFAAAGHGGAAGARAAGDRYLWSVTPCLVAWPAVALDPGPGALVAACTLGLAAAVDAGFARKGLLPPWYMSLRIPLTAGACAGLALTAGAALAADAADARAAGRAEGEGL